MAKKSSTKATDAKPSRTTPAQLKRSLTRLDRELVKLLNERAATYQQYVQQSTQAAPRERRQSISERIDPLVSASHGPLPERALRGALRELESGCRSLVKPVRVAYLGPQYSYSYLATVSRFGGSAELQPVTTIATVFEEVDAQRVDYGLVPIENSTDGRIVDTLDMFARLPVKICGEVQLAIHHNLLGTCQREQITTVYSKPQALSQCRNWLAHNLPQAKLVEMASTAAAAKRAADEDGTAAIASRQAGINCGLDVIAGNIEDNEHNVTRFAVIGHEPANKTGDDKTALMFELSHQPGSLADVMGIFKRTKLNLTWIESFPMPETPNEYLFFVELLGHPQEARVKRALESLGKKTVRVDVLGAYARTQPID